MLQPKSFLILSTCNCVLVLMPNIQNCSNEKLTLKVEQIINQTNYGSNWATNVDNLALFHCKQENTGQENSMLYLFDTPHKPHMDKVKTSLAKLCELV